MVQMTKHDLLFIIRQIKIAEAHSAGTELTDIRVDADGNVVTDGSGTLAISHPLAPYGLRTVDGSYNNVSSGREQWGASDHPFTRLTDPNWDNGYTSDGSANVVDGEPRLISNLIVDQTLGNPAAIAAALTHAGYAGANLLAALDAITTTRDALAAADPADAAAVATAQADLDTALADHSVEMDGPTVVIPNVAPDEGLSAPYNSWFTLFGQFFDHGLDLVAKQGGMVMIPLSPDDPLYVEGSPTNFMVLTRSLDDAPNITTPYVDQNQTYGSHASKQLFMREYAVTDDGPVSTGKLLEGATGGLATWADVKAQARDVLGIALTDADIGNIPLFAVDAYGEFIRGANGLPQMVVGLGDDGLFGTADDELLEGNLAAPIDPSEVGAFRTGHAFLDDIAHLAAPKFNLDGSLAADSDDAVGYSGGFGPRGNTSYDDELLNAHFITGDGRGNENIGLTTVHHVFHSEHNRMVDQIKEIALAEGATDIAFLNEWLLVDIAEIPSDLSTLQWDGERLFQGARVPTEMQYQHLVFEEFARKVQPDVDAFVFNPSTDIDPAIFAEFAHVVYRFGHSMLNETVDRIGTDGVQSNLDLFDAFLNPIAFDDSGLDASAAAGAIARGMTGQVGMEIDEFVANVLRNQLLGIPLDLATLNIARGRETGMPSLNEARAQFREIAQGDTQLDPYTSWVDFAANLKNPLSIVNFVAAYGTHQTIIDATTIEGKRDAAFALVFGDPSLDEADRLDFLHAEGAYTSARGGVDDIDLWVGGLAEKKMAFGGMLGSTFSFVFELQLENLQNGDRFYYLSRAQGLNLLNELENNSLAKMVLNNTDLGETGYAVPGDIFSVPDHVVYVDQEMMDRFGLADPTHDDPTLIVPMVRRVDSNGDGIAELIRVTSNDHFLIQGTSANDHIVAGGGDDSVWGGAGDDRIEAGYGVDRIHGGTGDDIITNSGTDIGEVDMLHGEDGNDVIHGGSGLALIFGNQGQDFIITGPDGKEAFGGTGNDFILGGEGGDFLLGNEGDDWLEGGNGFDVIAGDNSELFFNSTILGHDVMFAGQNEQDFDAESGDDIMGQGASVIRNEGMFGYDWAIHKFNTEAGDSDMKIRIFTTDEQDILRDRFDQTEALSGWFRDDILRGDDRTNLTDDGEAPVLEQSLVNNELSQAGVNRINGLRELFGDWVAAAPDGVDLETVVAFDSGNILLGGGGSDIIEGRGGNDLIDGNAWLNVRIRIEHDGVIYSAEQMAGKVYLESDISEGLIASDAIQQFGGASLHTLMLSGRLNPGQLSIVREVVEAASDNENDIAQYWDVFENYTITDNGDGTITVAHTGFDEDSAPANTFSDGEDRLRNIETLRFSDGAGGTVDFLVDPPVIEPNQPATGTPSINDATPTEGFALSAITTDIADPDGISQPFIYQWQYLVAGEWVDISGATAANFTPAQDQVGSQLRVAVTVTDDLGVSETILSAPSGIVGDLFVGTNGVAWTANGTAGDDVLEGANRIDTLNGGDGDDILRGGISRDEYIGGSGNDFIFDIAGQNDTAHFSGPIINYSFRLNDLGQLQVTDNVGTDGQDTLIGIDRMVFDSINRTLRQGTNSDDTMIMPATTSEILLGLDGDDTLDGGLGADFLAGGVGDDIVRGGHHNDFLIWEVGDGRDFMDGGGSTDHAIVSGDASSETFGIYTRSIAETAGIALNHAETEIVITRNGQVIAELDNIEEVVINGHGGGDTFDVQGNFTGTSLHYNTITLNGTDANDTVNISGLASAHRVAFQTNGGEDTVIGTLRPQDVVIGNITQSTPTRPGSIDALIDLGALDLTPQRFLRSAFLASEGENTLFEVGGMRMLMATNGFQDLGVASLLASTNDTLQVVSPTDLSVADTLSRTAGPGASVLDNAMHGIAEGRMSVLVNALDADGMSNFQRREDMLNGEEPIDWPFF